ncbi:hypothetical protein DTO271D3_6153 [Paecilomyces variotii]|nr:hypothetical protein DTO169E5_8295 [Paecilomyces variotii]KAJ9262803.1 hypothetical protein DTO212C5_7814 [Paecilomyces variotii]KAJ9313649.1 hypothetical protein DTO271D3_6153 [Paecilomyces variotii]
MAKPSPLSWTLLFRKHKTTVLLMLPPNETITSAKTELLKALNSRGLKEINGDPVPEDPSEIEFGVPVDKNELEKGWTRLDVEVPGLAESGTKKKKRNGGEVTLQGADIKDGQSIAFRFRKPSTEDAGKDQLDLDLELEDPSWDVIVPSLDDEEPES